MQTRSLKDDENAADKVIVIALVALLTISVISGLAYMSLDDESRRERRQSNRSVDRPGG